MMSIKSKILLVFSIVAFSGGVNAATCTQNNSDVGLLGLDSSTGSVYAQLIMPGEMLP